MDLEKQELRKKHRRARKMMLLFSLLSITMTFAGLTSAYIVSKARPDWLTDFQLPNYFFISTVIIIISSLSMWLAKINVKKNNFSKTSLWLGVTFLLSLFFIFSQFAGYQELINDGYYFTGAQSTVTTSFLYVLSLLFPSTKIISNLLGIFLNLLSAFIKSCLFPDSFLAGIMIDIK